MSAEFARRLPDWEYLGLRLEEFSLDDGFGLKVRALIEETKTISEVWAMRLA